MIATLHIDRYRRRHTLSYGETVIEARAQRDIISAAADLAREGVVSRVDWQKLGGW